MTDQQSAESIPPLHPGDSAVQREAEGHMLALLGERLHVELRSRSLPIGDDAHVVIDGADKELSVLVECYAHQGTVKPAQRHKVAADALKLLAVAVTLPSRPRLVLCLSDPEAARQFTTARSWIANALRSLGVAVEVVRLPPGVVEDLLAAQDVQGTTGNVRRPPTSR